jgi:GNAT superfamily N-acetyltransferase
MRIAALDPLRDRAALTACLAAASDYYLLWLGHPPGAAEVDDFLTDCPPGCDPAAAQRLGLWDGAALNGVAELSFGFPAPEAAYLGYMILRPEARGQGLGAAFLAEIEARARAGGAQALFLAVLEANPRGMAFWRREGFVPTGVSRVLEEPGAPRHVSHRLRKPL